MANTIGAGVYTTSGFALEALGTRESVIAVWIAASVLAMAGAVSFGALSRHLPESGGEFLYLSRLLHPCAGFIAGWVSLVAGFAGAQAFAAITLIEYMTFESRDLEMAIAIAVLIALSATHGLLVKAGTVLQNTTVAAKAIFLLGFVVIGANSIQILPTDSGTITDGAWTWPTQLLWVSLSFTGFNSAIYVASECRDPKRDIPRALLLGTFITAILYISVNMVFLYSGPVEQLKGVPNIAMVSAQLLGGPTGQRAVQALVLLSLFTLLSGMAVAGPRVAVQMGEDGYLPPLSLSQATCCQCFLAVVMTMFSNLVDQLSYLSLTLSLTSALAVATLFKIPKSVRPPSVFPVLYLGGTLMAAGASARNNPSQCAAAVLTLASGALIYFLLYGRKGQAEFL